jgi:antirestriction protein
MSVQVTCRARVYVGTYRKYAGGSIAGAWVDIGSFDDYDAFVAFCAELHKDESDPEYMVQDYEGFPRELYHESGLPTEDEFDQIKEMEELSDEEYGAYADYCDYEGGSGIPSIESFRENYYGDKTEKEVAEELAEEMGYFDAMEKAGLNAGYFDIEAYARDLFIDSFYRTKEGRVFRI